MSVADQVAALMNTMAAHNCSLLDAQLILTREFTDQMETATSRIRTTFEQQGSLTKNSKIGA